MATYTDYTFEGNHVRYFPENTESSNLVWHRDRKDRNITPIENTDWQIQFDNELPKPIKGRIFIREGQWHRVIKGSGCLKILINE
jgi:hypothetical protein